MHKTSSSLQQFSRLLHQHVFLLLLLFGFRSSTAAGSAVEAFVAPYPASAADDDAPGRALSR
jgi:hypothetical protein